MVVGGRDHVLVAPQQEAVQHRQGLHVGHGAGQGVAAQVEVREGAPRGEHWQGTWGFGKVGGTGKWPVTSQGLGYKSLG